MYTVKRMVGLVREKKFQEKLWETLGDTHPNTNLFIIIACIIYFQAARSCNKPLSHQDMVLLKVALSQKILVNFYISNINIPNHYPEQKI